MLETTTQRNNWIEVDKEGLQQVFPKEYIIRELIANMYDEKKYGAKNGIITIKPLLEREQLYRIIAEDDSPKGFRDLSDSYTMFRYTEKRKDPEVRGRFNSGDKYVLAHSNKATITSTTGCYYFNEDGTKMFDKGTRTERGSILEFDIKFERQSELEKIIADLKYYKSPNNFDLVVHNQLVTPNKSFTIEQSKQRKIGVAEGNLQTWYIDDNDNQKNISRRKTKVFIYEEDQSYIYEMGIPVQKIDDRFSYDVQQKVPLDQNREMVSDKFLTDVRGICLNAVSKLLTEEDLSEKWVDDGLSSKNVDDSSFETITKKKFPKSTFWSNDPYSNDRALLNGYNIIHSRTVPKAIRDRMRDSNIVQSSSTQFSVSFTDSVRTPRTEITSSMKRVEAFVRKLGRELLNIKVIVEFLNNRESNTLASYSESLGTSYIRFNVGRLGKSWFDSDIVVILDLVLHELAHFYSSKEAIHIGKSYVDGLSKLGARCTKLALEKPQLFELSQYQ